MSSNAKVTRTIPFCAEDQRFAGAVEVVEVALGPNRKTIGLRLRVGNRFVHLARHRTAEVIAALTAGGEEASNQYKQVIKEMNKS